MAIISPWTEKEVKLLVELWNKGLSSSLIAEEFQCLGYKVTRNSVVGKLHRLGLSKNDRQSANGHLQIMTKRGLFVFGGPKHRPRKKKGPVARSSPPTIKSPGREKRSPMITPRPENHVLLIKTKDNHCRAIIGYEKGLAERAVCCGEETVWSDYKGLKRRLSWCEYHYKIYLVEPYR